MKTLLKVENLKVWFHTRAGVTRAVDGIDFQIDEGEILGVVGESGSGKSVCCYSLLGLVPCPPGRVESGSARFEDRDLLRMPAAQLRHIRGSEIAVIFQDPMTCLNPYLTIGEQLIEPLLYHRKLSREASKLAAIELLREVGIREPEKRFSAYPHEFSGGMRQRVMIAMALIAEPKLLICDEPTTALDVTIQRQILSLIKKIQSKRKLSVIFITHDLGVVAGIADRVLVMTDGRIVEQAQTSQLFASPEHPYTRKLLAAMPQGDSRKGQTPDTGSEPPLVSINDLSVRFPDHTGSGNRFVKAVDNVTLSLPAKRITGLVGESGSGKSTLGRAVLRLVDACAGEILFDGIDLLKLPHRQLKTWRPRMQMIFQDPYASLNPRMTVFQLLAEPMLFHGLADRKTVAARVLSLMDDVGLARESVRKYPHEFSGGQRQRIAIGRAIATKPAFIVADEPVSALDVTIQAQILTLIQTLVEEHNLTMLFISHDLSVVREIADNVAVMRLGKIIESGRTADIWENPQASYTRELLSAVPLPNPAIERQRYQELSGYQDAQATPVPARPQ
ncbi:MAG: ABC transporter ATP-binding protein [bacterium]